MPAVPVPPAAPSGKAHNWLALDNITLLLYLGAALVVIAAGVFIASAWDAIGGVLRWGIVAAIALLFLVVGEGMRRASPVLGRAGETFRAVGLLLLPFVVLAFFRFVLEGEASPYFWVASGAGLALVYYTVYHLTTATRLPLYLGALSLGVVVLVAPDLFDADEGWRGIVLLGGAAALVGVVRLAEPDGVALWQRLLHRRASPLAESHLLVGALLLLASWGATLAGGSEVGLTTVYLLLQTLLFVALASWLRSFLFVGGAAFASGCAVYAATDLLMRAGDEGAFLWLLLAGWNGLAWGQVGLAPPVGRALRYGGRTLEVSALTWSTVAVLAALLAAAVSEEAGALHVTVAAYALTALLVAVAVRYRHVLPLWLALPTLHLALFAMLLIRPPVSPSLVVPTGMWLALAGLWVVAERRLALWSAPFFRWAFPAEALWVLLFSIFDETAALVAGVGLTVGWIGWARLRQHPTAAALVLLQVLYAEAALAARFDFPVGALALMAVASALLLLGLASHLPLYAQDVSDRGGLLLLLAAPALPYLALGWGVPAAPLFGLPIERISQWVLFMGAIIFAGRGRHKASRWPIAVSAFQMYALYAWLAMEQDVTAIQAYSVPLALLLAGLIWFFPQQRDRLEGASLVALLLPAALQSLSEPTLLYSLVLGLWGLLLIGVGISLRRRASLAGGVAAVLLAALRQLWEVVTSLPPGVVIGVVGLLIMVLAVLLTLRRQALLDIRERSMAFWERLDRDPGEGT